MGATRSNELYGKEKRGSRGSVNNANRLEAFVGRKGKGNADWGGVHPDRIQAVVVGITSLGGAVTFGLSRDEGAHSLTLLLDDARETLWFNGNADLNDELDRVLATLSAIT